MDLDGPLVDLAPVQVHQSKRLAPKTLHTLGGPGGPRPPEWHRSPTPPACGGDDEPQAPAASKALPDGDPVRHDCGIGPEAEAPKE